MFKIPSDKLPTEWKDEDRLNVLYSPFRSKTTNAKDWETKISSWKNLISIYCLTNGVYSFTTSYLGQIFTRHGRPPAGLTTIVSELVKSGDLQPEDQFMKKNAQSWGLWMTDVIKTPINWSLTTLRRNLFTPTDNREQPYVHITVIKQAADDLLSKIPSKWDNKVVTLSQVRDHLQKDNTPCQPDHIKLLLHYLTNEGRADVATFEREKHGHGNKLDSVLIKFTLAHKRIKPISDVEIGLHVLEQNESIFAKHVEELEDEISGCVKEAKAHLVKGHRQLAKTTLRKKHEIEKRLARKVDTLHNIHVMLEKIKDAQSDAEVMKSYKQALVAFNTTFKESGLSEDAVEDTMSKLGDVMDIHQDIESAISRPITGDNFDDEDLEAELAQLVNGGDNNGGDTSGNVEEIENKMADLGIKLPDVPSHNESDTEISLSQL